MRGTVKQRAKGTWTLIVDLPRDGNGERRQKWMTHRGTRIEAEKRLTELLRELDTGVYITPAKVTLAEYLDRWLRDYAANRVRATTLEGYRWRSKRLIDGLGDTRLADLRPEHIQAYYAAKLSTGELAGGTLIKHHHLLKQALDTAVKWRLVSRNVAALVDPPRREHREMRALTPAEVHRLLESCQGTPWHPIFHTLIWTGLRRSELLGLRWKDVDPLLATLRVTQVLHQLGDGAFVYAEPKTAKGKRSVALSPTSCLMLRVHRERQEADMALLGLDCSPDTLVFSHTDGSPLRPDSVGQAFRRLARRAGLPGVRLHDLRHTHASLLLQQGVNIKVIQERLGHANVQITLDTYSHLLPGMQEAAISGFDAVIEPAPFAIVVSRSESPC